MYSLKSTDLLGYFSTDFKLLSVLYSARRLVFRQYLKGTLNVDKI